MLSTALLPSQQIFHLKFSAYFCKILGWFNETMWDVVSRRVSWENSRNWWKLSRKKTKFSFKFVSTSSCIYAECISCYLSILTEFKRNTLKYWSLHCKNLHIKDKVLKNGPSKICKIQPLKYLNWYGLVRQIIAVQIF